MNKIETIQELRMEIMRVRQQSEHYKTAIRKSYTHFKNSLTPINIIMSILAELNLDKVFKSATGIVDKVREFFKSS